MVVQHRRRAANCAPRELRSGSVYVALGECGRTASGRDTGESEENAVAFATHEFSCGVGGGGADCADNRRRIGSATGTWLSSLCGRDRDKREHLEDYKWRCHGVVEGRWRADRGWSGDFAGWKECCFLGVESGACFPSRDASRRHQRTHRDRYARHAGNSHMGTGWTINRDGRK